MDLFVIDDSAQRRTSRAGMGPLVGVGGLHVPSTAVRPLELALDDHCSRTGFPAGHEFKWSPDSKSWMYDGLKYEDRRDFFLEALRLTDQAGATAIIVAEDTEKQRARRKAASPEQDVVTLFLERAQNHLASTGTEALVVFDQPSGGRRKETDFLAGCMATIREGTAFVDFSRLGLVLASDSRLVRLLQLADLVAGCTLAFVAGEQRYAPPVFAAIRPLLREESGRRGGVGLKLHPDLRYVNLYYWLLGDEYYWRGSAGKRLPIKDRPYFESAETP